MRRNIRTVFGFFAVASLAFHSLAARPANEAAVERRIEHIQHQLLPAVLVKGEPISFASLAARMDALHVPGVSIAVIHAGHLDWARGFGVTRIGGPPVTPETRFQAASISKVVSTLAVLNLAQARTVDLDTDVNQYLKTWTVPGNEYTQQAKVTLRGLLTHSAGITVHGFAGYEAGAPLPTIVQVLNGEAPANNSAIRVDQWPGQRWRYSGGGFVIAQQVLADVTGLPFPQLMQERVLGPLGMTHSTFEQPLPQTLLTHTATPYRSDGSAVPGGPHVYPELAAAGLWTTPSDLARYAIGVQQAFSGQSERVLSAASAHALLTPVYNQQALGLVVAGTTARKYFNHGGANEGYRCYLVAYESGDGAVIMTNSDSGGELTAEILRTLAHAYEWPDFAPPERTLGTVDPTAFDPYVGAYRFPSGEIATFWRDGSQVRSRIWGQPIVDLFPSSSQDYFAKVVDARWTFATDSASANITATLQQNGQEQPVTRLDADNERAALELSRLTQKRFQDRVPAPASESVLTRMIAGLAQGHPHYEEMNSGLAQLTRQELPSLQATLEPYGALQSVAFKRVGSEGMDIYQVTFEHGALEFQVLLDAQGHIDAARFSP